MTDSAEEIRFYGFDGKYGFLSNFFPTNQVFGGVTYPTNEHFFQAAKAIDPQQRQAIIDASSPLKARSLGRKCRLIPGWEDIKEDVMLTGLRVKFSDRTLHDKLIATEDALLIEDSPRDSYWGAANDGKNRLGYLLMQVRSELRA